MHLDVHADAAGRYRADHAQRRQAGAAAFAQAQRGGIEFDEGPQGDLDVVDEIADGGAAGGGNRLEADGLYTGGAVPGELAGIIAPGAGQDRRGAAVAADAAAAAGGIEAGRRGEAAVVLRGGANDLVGAGAAADAELGHVVDSGALPAAVAEAPAYGLAGGQADILVNARRCLGIQFGQLCTGTRTDAAETIRPDFNELARAGGDLRRAALAALRGVVGGPARDGGFVDLEEAVRTAGTGQLETEIDEGALHLGCGGRSKRGQQQRTGGAGRSGSVLHGTPWLDSAFRRADGECAGR